MTPCFLYCPHSGLLSAPRIVLAAIAEDQAKRASFQDAIGTRLQPSLSVNSRAAKHQMTTRLRLQ